MFQYDGYIFYKGMLLSHVQLVIHLLSPVQNCCLVSPSSLVFMQEITSI